MAQASFQQIKTPLRMRAPSPELTVQMDWIARAAVLPGKALHVAMAIARAASVGGTGDIVLGAHALDRFGVSRDAAYAALAQLAKAGLISADRCRGRRARISLKGS